MRRITLYILVALMGMSCGRANYAKLVKVDSLLAVDSAHSAMMILKTFEPNDLTSENNAYYALLYTQAQYKLYEPIDSDSLISIAVKYYTDNFDQDKLTRSLMYRGAVYADLNFRQLALDSYNEAEQIVDTTDLMTMGLLNFRLGELYQNSYIDNNEPVVRYKRAANYFRLAHNESFENYSYSYIGQMYIEEDYDSAYYYLNKTIDWANKHEDEMQLLNSSRYILSKLYWFHRKYPQKRKDLLLSIYSDTIPFESDIYFHLTNVYCELGLIDSAKFYATQYPVSRSPEDTMSYHMMLESLAVAQKDYKRAYQNKIAASTTASKIISQGKAEEYYTIDRQYDNSVANAKVENLSKERTIHLTILAIVVLLLCIVLLLWWLYRKHRQQAVVEQQRTIDLLRAEIERKSSSEDILNHNKSVIDRLNKTDAEKQQLEVALKAIIEERIRVMRELLNISHVYESQPVKFMKQFNSIVSATKQSTKQCDELIGVANQLYDNIIDYLSKQHPNLSYDDKILLSLACFDYTAVEMKVFLNLGSMQAIYSMRHRLGKKLNTDSLGIFIRETKRFLR